jgi:hypothetical protein
MGFTDPCRSANGACAVVTGDGSTRRRSGKTWRTRGAERTGARVPTTDQGESEVARNDAGRLPEAVGWVPGVAHDGADWSSEETGPLALAVAFDDRPSSGEDSGSYTVDAAAHRPVAADPSTPDAVELDGPPPSTRPDGRPTLVSPDWAAPLPWASAIVRPYARTRGRTRSSHELALEALVSASQQVVSAVGDTSQRRMIIDICSQPRSVAEVAALLAVPLGVARVLVGDLASDGSVIVHPTVPGLPDLDFMQRVLVGLRKL